MCSCICPRVHALTPSCSVFVVARMSETCFQKCVAQYNDADLSVGEMSCVDRCVGKYLAVHERVQHKMQSMGEQVSQRM